MRLDFGTPVYGIRDGADTRLGLAGTVFTDAEMVQAIAVKGTTIIPSFLIGDVLKYIPGFVERLGQLQKKLTELNWAVGATDQRKWDSIWTEMQGKTPVFTGWAWTRMTLATTVGKILVTNNYPSLADVRWADQFGSDVEAMLDLYKRMFPGDVPAVTGAQNQVRTMLEKVELEGQGTAMWNAFIDELNRRGKEYGWIAMAALALAGAAFIFGRRR